MSDQSVRDYLDLRHPEGWHTESHLTQALGYFSDELECLTRRWMRLYRRRERRKHEGEQDGKAFPTFLNDFRLIGNTFPTLSNDFPLTGKRFPTLPGDFRLVGKAFPSWLSH